MNRFRSWSSLILLNLAAVALTLAGYSYRNEADFNTVGLLIIGTIVLTSFVYFFNDVIDNFKNYNWFRLFIGSRFGLSLLAFVAFQFVHLSFFEGVSLSSYYLILAIGLSYSFKIPLGLGPVRFKNYYYLKNFFIALGWSLLLFYGHGQWNNYEFQLLALFVFFQVFIGSSIRDIADIESDSQDGVNTLPVRLGIPATLMRLHFVNFISCIVILLDGLDSELVWMIPVVAWRILNLETIRKRPTAQFNLQFVNLFTCVLIFISRVVA